jgi:DnaK suppressor protein
MKEETLAKIKNKLLKDREHNAKQIKELQKDDPISDGEYQNDNAAVDTDVREQEWHQRLEAQIQALITRNADIDQALSRIEKGRYGYCKRCNKEIPAKRLELVPEAIYCVTCENDLKR